MRRISLLLLILLTGRFLFSQSFTVPSYPKDYFRNPMGIPMQLSANFGELRPNHWHMGLDIRTEAKENYPVYAAAEGYIAKVGIRPQSFGRFIIINHPNGLSTLYAHLNDFYPELEAYVTAQQYEQESWAVELLFNSKQFPVSKGAFIAYSGNTGGSRGPHLHFEIIDTKTDKRLNPLLFNFPLQDNIPPALERLAMYDRSRSVFAQSPVFYSLKNTDSGYIIPKVPVINTGLNKVSFALQMHDKTTKGGSPNGVFSAKLYLDDEPLVGFMLDSISYDETVYMNAHIDYKHDYKGGAYLQHLSKLPGDNGVAYKIIKNDGVIHLQDTLLHYLAVEVKDASGNTTWLNFAIRYSDSLAALLPARSYVQQLPAQQENRLEKPDFKMFLPAGCVYDSVPAYYYREEAGAYNAVTAKHQVNDPSYPVHDDFTVQLKPTKTIPAEWKDKLLMVKSGKGNTIRKTTLTNGWLSAVFGDFGSFQAFADITPPGVNGLGKGDTVNLSASSRIVFTPTDNFGIKKFRAELATLNDDSTVSDYKWLRFTNDKSRNWIYKFDERCPYGVHHLKVTVEDLAGNTTVKEWWFRRAPYTPPPPKKKSVKSKSTSSKKTDSKKTTSKKTDTKKKTTTTKKPVKKK
ncbi:MAG: M23 family metallopeptidase [Chitinophagaceae bacterium]|nr:M23 family metallopeptidase [Chitinophagaceae bacterium]